LVYILKKTTASSTRTHAWRYILILLNGDPMYGIGEANGFLLPSPSED
jgi:hypothetical protein